MTPFLQPATPTPQRPQHTKEDIGPEASTSPSTDMRTWNENSRSGSLSTISVVSLTGEKISVRTSSSRGTAKLRNSEKETLHKTVKKTIKKKSQRRRRQGAGKNTTAYDKSFEEFLMATGIYLADVPDADASNLETLFNRFRSERTRALCEQDVLYNLLPLIEGPDSAQRASTEQRHRELQFDHFRPLARRGLVKPKPDRVYASSTHTLKRKICEDLSDRIRPSKRARSTICPNFTLELKGPHGSGTVAERQACYNAAFGARAMHALRAYGKRAGDAGAVYDGNAYTLSSTFERDSGTLTLYATYPRKANRHGGSEYIMTTIDSWSMKGNMESWERAITAYRNARDWAREKREEAIGEANERVSAGESSTRTRITRSTLRSHAAKADKGEANQIGPGS